MSREIWRLLDYKIDRRKIGDQILHPEKHNIWESACETEKGEGSEFAFNRIYRRRETIEDEPKWEEVKNRTATTWSMYPRLCRYEDGTFHFLPAQQIQSHHATHYLVLPPFPQADPFETFWQRNKERLLDTTKEAARVIYEEARK